MSAPPCPTCSGPITVIPCPACCLNGRMCNNGDDYDTHRGIQWYCNDNRCGFAKNPDPSLPMTYARDAKKRPRGAPIFAA